MTIGEIEFVVRMRDELSKQLGAASKQVEGFVSKANADLKGMIGGAFAVAAIQNFVGDIMAMADEIVKTSEKTGLLIEEVQQLSYIADQSGNSLGQVTGAMSNMQQALSGGNKGIVGAVKELGLSFTELRTLSPYESFERIAAAIAKVPNPADQSRLAVAAFGKTGAEILPTLIADFEALGNAAPKMSENTVRALEEAGDAWSTFAKATKVFAAEAYNVARGLFDQLIVYVFQAVAKMREATADLVETLSKAATLLAPVSSAAATAAAALGDKATELRQSAVWYRDAATAMNLAIEDTGKKAKAVVPPMKGLTDAQEEAAKAAKQYAEEVRKLAAELGGQGVAGDLKKLEAAWRLLTPAQQANAEVIARTVEAYKRLRQDGANSELLNNLSGLHRIIQLMNAEFVSMAPNLGAVTLPLAQFRIETAGAVLGGRDLNATLGTEMDGAMRRATVASDGATDALAALRARGFAPLGEQAKQTGATVAEAFQFAADVIGKFANESKLALVASTGLAVAAQVAAKNYVGGMMAIYDAYAQWASKKQAEVEAAWRERMADISEGVKLEQDLVKTFGSMTQAIAVAQALGLKGAAEAMQRLRLDMDTEADRITLAALDMEASIAHMFGAVKDNAGLASAELRGVIEQLDAVKATSGMVTDFIRENAQTAGKGLNALIGGLAGSDAAKQRKAIDERSAAFQMGAEAEIAAAQYRVDEMVKIEKRLGDELKVLRKGEQTDASKARQASIQGELEAIGEKKAIYETDVKNQQDALAAKLAAFKAESDGVIGVFMQTEEQARGLAAAVVGSFGEMLARGVPLREALEAVQPAITTMQQQLEATGFTGGAAFGSLVEMSRIANDAIMGPAVDAIGGAREALTGLHNSGLLNQEMFSGIAMSATQAYDAIVAQGGDGTAALMMMQPTLQTLWKLQEDFGYEVDEGTQALLDQAEAAGIVGAERLSDAEKQTAAQEKLVEQMGELLAFFQRLIPVSENAGHVVKNTFDKAGQSATDAGQKIKAAKLDQAFKDSDEAAGDLDDTTGDVKQSLFDAGRIGVEAWAKVGTEAGTAESKIDLLKGATDTLYSTFDGYDFSESIRKITSDAEEARDALSRIYDDMPTAPPTTTGAPSRASSFGGGVTASALAAAPRQASGGDLRVPVYLDGRQIAEAVYADLPGVLQARGVL
jgi:hypothetical protein